MRLERAGWCWVAICCASWVVAGAAAAGSLSTNVQVRVRLVSSSGVCGTASTEPGVEVTCRPPAAEDPAAAPQPRGPLLPEPGDVPYQRASSTQVARIGVAKEPLQVRSVGTKITSWRVVQLDNARYLELTIAW